MPTKFDYRLLNESDTSLIYNFNSSIENLAYVPRSPFNSISEADVLLAKFLKSMDDKTAIWWAFYNLRSGKPFGLHPLQSCQTWVGYQTIRLGVVQFSTVCSNGSV